MTSLHRAAGIALFLVVCGAVSGQEPLNSGDIQSLLRGVGILQKSGVPVPISLIDSRATTLVAARIQTSPSQRSIVLPLIAVARYGKGSILAIGVSDYLAPEILAQGGGPDRLIRNYMAWRGLRKGDLVCEVNNVSLKEYLENARYEYASYDGQSLWEADSDFRVLIIRQGGIDNAKHAARLAAWVKSGGNLICSVTKPWPLLKFLPYDCRDLNKALASMGLFFAAELVDTVIQPADASPELLRSCNASRALEELVTAGPEDAGSNLALKRAGDVLGVCLRWIPLRQHHFIERMSRQLKQSRPSIIPTKKNPLTSEHVLARLSLTVDQMLAEGLETREVKAAPSAADFPGQPDPLEKPVTRRIKVNPRVPGWKSTGLYARAGKPVSVSLPGRARKLGLRLRIGSHSDRLWDRDSWTRHPEVSCSWSLSASRESFASPHGGLIYVEVPPRVGGRPIPVVIRGAYRALHYVQGETSAEEWQKAIKEVSAPWAELESPHVILTVTRESAAAIKDPEKLMTFWNDVLPLYAELGQRPLDRRPQRFVADRQISAGWLHSGYPIMMHLVHSDEIVNLSQLRDAPKDKCFGWGFWHELGHNHQREAWTPQEMTEVSCNFFSLYVEDRVRGIKPVNHPWPRGARGKVQPYLLNPDFSRWKKEPGLALWTFILIQDAFGWEVFQEVFKSYEEQNSQTRRSDQWKWDQILIRFSRACKRDLGPYFLAWGLPITPEVRCITAHLKPWFPKGFKMKGMNAKN